METEKNVFSKSHTKVSDLQEQMATFLKDDPSTSCLEMAEASVDWMLELDRSRQVKILEYAMVHIRKVVENKIRPKKPAPRRVVSEAAAAKLLREYNAKKIMELTFEQIDAVIGIGPTLRAKMQPGQKVKDVWSLRKVVGLLK